MAVSVLGVAASPKEPALFRIWPKIKSKEKEEKRQRQRKEGILVTRPHHEEVAEGAQPLWPGNQDPLFSLSMSFLLFFFTLDLGPNAE